MVKLSIIVPLYNVEQYLEKCVDSILEQSFSEFELILVNDGSTDSCSEICDNYKKKDNRIKVIHKQNGGLSSARNEGIKIAVGTYLAFVDSDDYINRDMYKILYNAAISEDSDISICNFLRVSKSDISKEDINNADLEYFTNIEALSQLYKNTNKVVFAVAWNKIYKKNLFCNLYYPNGRIHEDEFLAHRLLHNSKKIVYVNRKLYYYLQRENSIMKSDFSIKNLDAIYALRDRMIYFRNIKLIELMHKAEYEYIKEFFIYYKRAKNELNNIENELKELKRGFRSSIKYLLNNPLFNWKEKTMWIIFIFYSSIYKKY